MSCGWHLAKDSKMTSPYHPDVTRDHAAITGDQKPHLEIGAGKTGQFSSNFATRTGDISRQERENAGTRTWPVGLVEGEGTTMG